ncbi:hypothetical protein HPP92_011612 [Vanilla planifolia]|uniref:Glutaredoxin domain-containing protein n=1 Tax=Vanilla planifolia TaxID=51239 RepID=A0A835RBT6_VANPL|nr:hypothetical protein HPP92_011612 [Vanilla planifolia]
MGCISSKLLPAADLDSISSSSKLAASVSNATSNGNIPNHFVSLTSSTYGVLNLDPVEEENHPSATKEHPKSPPITVPKPKYPSTSTKEHSKSPSSVIVPKSKKHSYPDPAPEVINWTLADDVDDARKVKPSPLKRPSKLPPLFTPSPKMQGKIFGKENRSPLVRRIPVTEPNQILKPLNSLEKKQPMTPQSTSTGKWSGSRRSLSPFFDPELVASLERELLEQAEQIKQMISQKRRSKKGNDSSSLLCSYIEKCPPGGENALVLYTTTLRGIRKTFEECNAVRSTIQCYYICLIEKDISMDSGFREELRKLMGSKEVRPPVLFAKGRLIGGAAEVQRLEEEGKLEMLMEGIPTARTSCEECGGVRFVMCNSCNGSRKVLDEEQRKMVKCGECNENGLVYCSSCSQAA